MRSLPTQVATALIAMLALSGNPAAAHEFWISPDDYTPADGERIVAALRVGQMFNGSSFAYIPQNFSRFELVEEDMSRPVEGRMGDLPAMQMRTHDGLNVIVHQTTPLLLRYTEWAKFVQFCEHKDFAWALEDHKSRKLPETGFRESYTRFAKSLVGTGSGRGADRPTGMETEIVALANPYTDELSGGMPVVVLYQGKPRMDVQVEVFARAADGTVEDLFYRTDTKGIAVVPVKPGTEYLFDAVVMRPLAGDVAKDEPVWESLWASLTFRTPD